MNRQVGHRAAAPGPVVRPPAVAGAFYPDSTVQLINLVDRLLDGAAPAGPEPLAPAYVVPHAGYRYSGPIAAAAYARLRPHARLIRRIVLIGPAHRVPVRGCVASGAGAWRTPLGDVPVDLDQVDRLIQAGHATTGDAPHAPEHSLEVQLPFLQRALPDAVPVVPLLAGPAPPGAVADALGAAARPDGTVVLCSTDLSHYLDEHSARRQDAATVRAVADLAADRIGPHDACGAHALRGLLTWARRGGFRARLLSQGTSADTTGDRGRVVGYAAFAIDR